MKVVDTHFAKVTTEKDLFQDYNTADAMDESTIDKDVYWMYDDLLANQIDWEMHAFNIPWGTETPILPALHIRKVQIISN